MSSNSKRDFNFKSEEPVPCILCDLEFTVSYDIQPFLCHMLDLHNFLIESPLEILDIREYTIYWRKLKECNLEDYCILFNINNEVDGQSKHTTYYLLSLKLPEDNEIRSAIRESKLKYISNQMRTEWQDKTFSRKCVYCSNVIEGGLDKVFSHIKYDHNISLGSNIVFGAKLLDIIAEKLKNLLCLYCENQFKNHVSLREHMRKKHHKSLNPKNKMYDKFYLVNYVKPGTTWEKAKQELNEEQDDRDLYFDKNDEQLEWEDWKMGDDNETVATCLFCTFVTSKFPSDLYSHMVVQHKYNFEDHTRRMSFYERVKLVNYIRSKVFLHTCSSCSIVLSSLDELLRHMEKENHFIVQHRLWNDIQYFIPFLKNDEFLHSMEDYDVMDENSSGYASSNPEEIVFPEIFEINSPKAKSNNNSDDSAFIERVQLEVNCLFCSYIAYGIEACAEHMECNHSFSYKKCISSLPVCEGQKFVNYIRFMSAGHQCFACHRKFNVETSLVVHLQLCNHTRELNHVDYLDERWKITYLLNDPLILDLKKTIVGNTLSNKVSSTK